MKSFKLTMHISTEDNLVEKKLIKEAMWDIINNSDIPAGDVKSIEVEEVEIDYDKT